jgi:glucose/arabinose dehydrogenase
MKKIFYFYLISVILLPSCFKIKNSNGGGQVKNVKPRKVDAKDVAVPIGYRVEVVTTGLTFPTGITFDEAGVPYIVEAGYSYGEVWEEPRLLRIEQDGSTKAIATGTKNGPWNGVYFNNGFFYIAEGGELEGGKILKISKSGEVTTLVANLPSLGDHHTNGPVVREGYVYFGQGTATNAAVVGRDNYQYGWLKRYPDFHDIPCKDIILNGHNFSSENPLTPEPNNKALTGAYVPFGTQTKKDAVIQGQIPCSGAIFRVPVTGGSLELVAWGLRNPFGLAFTEDGKLFVSENGFDVRGNRPVWGTGDVLWEIKQGTWYGWPDYSAGIPIYKNKGFTPPDADPIVKILKENPNTPPKPAAVLGVHSSSNGMEVVKNTTFGKPGDLLIAQFGDMAPAVGKVWNPVGFKVVSVDPSTGIIRDFVANYSKKNGPASWLKNGGLERPNDVAFNPAGDALYIVDFGVLTMDEKGDAFPRKKTGVVWKVTHKP